MILIACVDDNLGLSFNNRRLSKDKVLAAHILSRVGERPAWVSSYTAKMLFGDDLARPLNWQLSNVPCEPRLAASSASQRTLQAVRLSTPCKVTTLKVFGSTVGIVHTLVTTSFRWICQTHVGKRSRNQS